MQDMPLRKMIFDCTIGALRLGLRMIGQTKGAMVSAYLVEQLTPVVRAKTSFGHIDFYCPGKIPFWRAENALAKEPETIEWLGTLNKDSVLWDIGANVGVYSLYVALKTGVRVLAFEPSAFNYFILNKNIEVNRLDDCVQAYCIAFNDVGCLDRFYMESTEPGGALHSFSKSVDWEGKPLQWKFRQGMVGISIDEFVAKYGPPFPTHIKIDVDGNETRIMMGARKTFSDARLKSVLVELDTASSAYPELTGFLKNCGLTLLAKKHDPIFDTGKYAAVFNHTFGRSEA